MTEFVSMCRVCYSLKPHELVPVVTDGERAWEYVCPDCGYVYGVRLDRGTLDLGLDP